MTHDRQVEALAEREGLVIRTRLHNEVGEHVGFEFDNNALTMDRYECGMFIVNSKGLWAITHNAMLLDDDPRYRYRTPDEAWEAAVQEGWMRRHEHGP